MKPPALQLPPEDWHAVLGLLDQALGMEPAWREAWLASPAPEHRHLQAALRQLLDDRQAIETDDFLGSLPSLAVADSELAAGQHVGPYELQRELGHGGMASVWLARRADGAHQRAVALKLPFTGPRTRHIGERFERERQILSALTHPHIASVLDAGTDGAQPWLAMEYVEGLAITDWARERGLDVAARLRLFQQILQAVQHAHAQLVIHRDLKPGNVLVDAHGQVKLLDFGVAKLLGHDSDAPASALTQEGGRAMTPAYASPEQVRGTVLGTASDIYTLGVLLHQLLTGALPYARPGQARLGAAAVEQAILAGELQRPSQCVADTRLARRLRGDIDTIVAKALHAEPAQRYASAAAFAEDIERHLSALPITARPHALGYRLRKLWQRQRLPLLAAAVVALALAAGLSAALWQGQRAQDEARRAEAVQQFLVKLLQRTDPQQGQARDLPAGELLDLSVARLGTEFTGPPDVRAQLLQTLASIYAGRGEPAKARPLLERAIAHHAAKAAGSLAHVQALVDMTVVLDGLGDFAAERPAIAQAQALAERYFGRDHRWADALLASLAWVELNEGALDQAAGHAEQARAGMLRRQGEQSADYIDLGGTLATIYMTQGRLQEARTVLLRTEQLEQGLPGPVTVERAMTAYNLARVDYILGEHGAAQARLRQWLPLLDRIAGPGHQRTLLARSLLAQSLAENGQAEAALAEQRANLAALQAQATGDEDELSTQQATLARVLRLAGRSAEGLPLARDALARAEARSRGPSYRREAMRRVLGETQLALGQREAGVNTLEAALGHLQTLPASGANVLGSVDIRVALAMAQRERAQARELIGQACASVRAYQPENGLPLRRCEALRAWVEALQVPMGERPAAARRFLAARDQLAAGLPERHALRAELLLAEAELLALDPAQRVAAAALRKRADALHRDLLDKPLPDPLLIVH